MTYEEHVARMEEHKADSQDAWEEYEAGRIDDQTRRIWLECADRHFDR